MSGVEGNPGCCDVSQDKKCLKERSFHESNVAEQSRGQSMISGLVRIDRNHCHLEIE